MSALYAVRYAGRVGAGLATIWFGHGCIVGLDDGGGRYRGMYAEENGRIKGTIGLTMPIGGRLVSGASLAPGQKIAITVDWPADFADGKPRELSLGGQIVSVTVEKIGDTP
jgi:hypothetical protein